MRFWSTTCIFFVLLITLILVESRSFSPKQYDQFQAFQKSSGDKQQPRFPRGFKEMRLGIARGFGKRSCCSQFETGISYGFGKRGPEELFEDTDSNFIAHSKRKKMDSFSVKWFTSELMQNPTLTRAVLQNLASINTNKDDMLSSKEHIQIK